MPRRSGSDRADCQGVRDDDEEGADGADDICAYVTFYGRKFYSIEKYRAFGGTDNIEAALRHC